MLTFPRNKYQRIDFRGFANFTDGAPATEFTLYEEGTADEIVVGPSDVIAVEHVSASVQGTGNGILVYFGTTGSPQDPGQGKIIGLTDQTTKLVTTQFPAEHPTFGEPGEGVWILGNDASDGNGTILGHIYKLRE